MDDHGELEGHAATLRAFGEQTGASRVVLVLDRGRRESVMLDWSGGDLLDLVQGEQVRGLAAGAAEPRALPELRRLPPVDVDLPQGSVTGAIGTLPRLAGWMHALVAGFGGRSVVTAEWDTTDPGASMTLAARAGEPLLVALGDQHFELPGGAAP